MWVADIESGGERKGQEVDRCQGDPCGLYLVMKEEEVKVISGFTKI